MLVTLAMVVVTFGGSVGANVGGGKVVVMAAIRQFCPTAGERIISTQSTYKQSFTVSKQVRCMLQWYQLALLISMEALVRLTVRSFQVSIRSMAKQPYC